MEDNEIRQLHRPALCRRCRRLMGPPGVKVWLPDDTLFPGLPGTKGGWCCSSCGQAAGLRIKAA